MGDKDFLAYIKMFMDKAGFPDEAKAELASVGECIFTDAETSVMFRRFMDDLRDGEMGVGDVFEELNVLEDSIGISRYTLHLIYLMSATAGLLERCRQEGVSEEIFWDTMDDFRCKLLECKEVEGVWGTFVGTWYAGFLDFSRFALGRFQYELVYFDRDKYEKNGIVIYRGDPVYNFHIPSSGKPFGKEARLESYRKAYEFFGYDKKEEPIVFVCGSWLLYEGHREFLSPASNILGFMEDFDIIESADRDEFSDAWRVFGKYHKLPHDELPEDTSLRRAFKNRLKEGKKTGYGYGIIVFDGEKIIN